MMLNTLKTAIVLIGALGAVSAKADDLYPSFGNRGARFGVYLGDYSRMYYPPYRYRDEHRWSETRCSPERALDKARQVGVNRARIDYVTRREIGVIGRSRGERVYLTFARAPRCPIIG